MGSAYWRGARGPGLVFDEAAEGGGADLSAAVEELAKEAEGGESESDMAAHRAAAQRRLLLYPLCLIMMMPLWPWAYAWGSKPRVSPARAAEWGEKASRMGSGASEKWAQGRFGKRLEDDLRARAKRAEEARRMRVARGHRGFEHHKGRAAQREQEARQSRQH